MIHYVAPENGAPEKPSAELTQENHKPYGYWSHVWSQLKKSKKFWGASVVLVSIVIVVSAPGLFSSTDPFFCDLDVSQDSPSWAHPFGRDFQGCDIYARTIFGARASVLVGVCTAVMVFLLGGCIGILAGFFGGWWDALLSRVTEIFAGIPLILAAVVLLKIFPARGILTIVVTLAAFSWPQVARVARASAAVSRTKEYIVAAQSLGVPTYKILLRHVLPNSLGPLIATTTLSLGTFIVAESTLSYMGIGLPSSVASWGSDIASSQSRLLEGSLMMLYPATALGITVLAFILLGDALRDATDPKAKRR